MKFWTAKYISPVYKLENLHAVFLPARAQQACRDKRCQNGLIRNFGPKCVKKPSYVQSYLSVCHVHTLYNYMYSIRIRMIILNHVCIVLINTSPYLYIVIHCIRINIRYQETLPCTDSVGRWHRGFHPIWMSRLQYWICSDEVRCGAWDIIPL
jgi:hypothetical protein